MRFFAVILVTLFASSSFANNTPFKFELNKGTLKVSSKKDVPDEPAKVIRQAKADYVIMKGIYGKAADGSPTYTETEVCKGQVAVDVYSQGYISLSSPAFSCPSTFNGVGVEVQAFAFMTEMTVPVMPRSGMKKFSVLLPTVGFVDDLPSFGIQGAGTELTNKETVLFASSENEFTCNQNDDCTQKWDEGFHLIVNYID
jgi:hypothetical protein